jgi:hypothetical protein
MNDATTSDAWQMFRRVYWSMAVALAALLLLLALMGFGPGGRKCAATTSAAVDTGATTVGATAGDRAARSGSCTASLA